MKKAVYYFQNSNTLHFEDQEKENWSDVFVGWMDLSKEEILYGEFRKFPSPHITLETQKYYLYQRDDIEYNRKRVYSLAHEKRDKVLSKDEKLFFEYGGRRFDGNLRAKENIKGFRDALADLPSEIKSGLFPQPWRDFDNQDYLLETEQDFNLFYLAFMFYRLDLERNVNQKTFELKDRLNDAQTLEDVLQIQSEVSQIGHA